MKKLSRVFVILLLSLVISACNSKDSPAKDVAPPANPPITEIPEAVDPTKIKEEPSATPDSLMSPENGPEAFAKIYDHISKAKKYVYITIYSWSDGDLDKAIEQALSNKAIVKAIIHHDVKNSGKFKSIPLLEAKGAEFKIAPRNMHEKFTIVDDLVLVNTSANFSPGAKNRYSENFVFHEVEKDKTQNTIKLLNDFKNEFSILWNVSKDVITKGEPLAERMDIPKKDNVPESNQDMILYSSSMNWTLKTNEKNTSSFLEGRYQSLVAKKDAKTNEQTWVVRDILIEKIRSAQKSILLSLNHFNIRAVSDELIEAVKRGVDVKLAVDNQEFKSRPNNLEMTPQFVEDWKKLKPGTLPPVRVKYYSHEPSARNWLLNHHKYVLIDYELPEKTVLLSGSYNLSKNAEQNQFDNLVLYKTEKYKDLYTEFYNEFENLWMWNRVDDKPKPEVVNLFFTVKDNLYPLHIKEAVSLTWPEILELRSQVEAKAPGIFSGLTKNSDCLFYNSVTKIYASCPPK
jgi:phosphatidylserine/phosphatidylglycerophosphate/cardiolipin synthase-like enzyme